MHNLLETANRSCRPFRCWYIAGRGNPRAATLTADRYRSRHTLRKPDHAFIELFIRATPLDIKAKHRWNYIQLSKSLLDAFKAKLIYGIQCALRPEVKAIKAGRRCQLSKVEERQSRSSKTRTT
jgi:hypothetical protein